MKICRRILRHLAILIVRPVNADAENDFMRVAWNGQISLHVYDLKYEIVKTPFRLSQILSLKPDEILENGHQTVFRLGPDEVVFKFDLNDIDDRWLIFKRQHLVKILA